MVPIYRQSTNEPTEVQLARQRKPPTGQTKDRIGWKIYTSHRDRGAESEKALFALEAEQQPKTRAVQWENQIIGIIHVMQLKWWNSLNLWFCLGQQRRLSWPWRPTTGFIKQPAYSLNVIYWSTTASLTLETAGSPPEAMSSQWSSGVHTHWTKARSSMITGFPV